MKRITYLGVVLMATLIMTSCVKNEEADGVKAMREAQAKLIEAKAAAETVMSNAEASYKTALAAVENAKAAAQMADVEYQKMLTEYQKLINDAKQLENDLKAATNEMEKEELQAKLDLEKTRIAIQKADMEAAHELALKNFEVQKLLAEKALLDAQKALELDIANTEDEVLNMYLTKYSVMLNNIQHLQGEIIQAEYSVAQQELNLDDYAANLALKTTLINKKKAELVVKEAYLVKYKEVAANPDELQTKIDESNLRLSEIITKLAQLNEQKAPLDVQLADINNRRIAQVDVVSVLNNELLTLQGVNLNAISAYNFYVNYKLVLDIPNMLSFLKKPENILDNTTINIGNEIINKLDLEDAYPGDYKPLSFYKKQVRIITEIIGSLTSDLSEKNAVLADNKVKMDEQKTRFDNANAIILAQNDEIAIQNDIVVEQNLIISTNNTIIADANSTVAQKDAALLAINAANDAVTAANDAITVATEARDEAYVDMNAANSLFSFYEQLYDAASAEKLVIEQSIINNNYSKSLYAPSVIVVEAVITYLENMGEEATLKADMEAAGLAVTEKNLEVEEAQAALEVILAEPTTIEEAIAVINLEILSLTGESDYIRNNFLPIITNAKISVVNIIAMANSEMEVLESEISDTERLVKQIENSELEDSKFIEILKTNIVNLKAQLVIKQNQAEELKTLIDARLEA